MADISKIQIENGVYNIKDEIARREVVHKPYYFTTVADMKAYNLAAGDMAITEGYFTANDGGAGIYQIVNNNSLIDDGGSVHTLNNGLKAKLIFKNEINVKQFGAKGDGETDDSASIQNAINQNVGNIVFPKGEYYIENQVIIKNHNYIGYGATIVSNTQDVNIEYLIYNEHFLSNAYNTFTFTNINFKCNKVPTYFLSFKNIKNVVFENCRFYTKEDFNKTVHLLDLRCNSENVTIRDCDFYIDEESTATLSTCLLIRNYQGDTNSFTNNITVDNCTFSKNCQDEILWINSNSGLITNVNVNNCKIKDFADSSNTVWFGGSPSGTIKKCQLNNTTIFKEKIKTRLISIGFKETNTDTPTVEDISVNNCNISFNDTQNNEYTYVFIGDTDTSTNVSVNNTKIDFNNTTKLLKYCFYKIPYINDCIVNINNTADNILFGFANTVNSGRYTTTGLVTNANININNAFIDCKRLLALDYNGTGTKSLNLINTYFKASHHIIDSTYNTAVINALFKECIIKNTLGVSNFYSVSNSSDSNITLINTDISNDELIYANKPSLRLINITKNNQMFTGIPSQGNTRGACVIGTLFPTASNNSTHAFVKKTSDGDLESNWTEF